MLHNKGGTPMSEQNYHDKVNMENAIKLRSIQETLPLLVVISFEVLNLLLPLEQGSLMPMISVCFLNF